MKTRAGVRFTGIMLGVVAVVLATGMVTPGAASATRAARPAVSQTEAEPEAAVFRNWVAVGDSYSSGEGSPPFDADSAGSRCHRSSKAWPRLLGVDHHLACTGATIDDFYGSQRDALVALNQSRTVDAVTVTIGGNDIPFAGVISDCYQNEDCTLAGVNNSIDGVAQRLADIDGDGVYHDIETAAPAAEVIVVGYPRLLPTRYQDVVENCRPADGRLFSFSQAEVERLNETATHLDQRLRQAAGRAGVRYLSTLNALDGHELCTSDAWVRPIKPDCSDRLPNPSTLCGHPWERANPPKHGQRALANVVRQLTHRPPPTLGVVWGPNQQGFGQVRPRKFYGGGTSTGMVRQITWTSWGGQRARGRGIGYYIPPGGYGYQARPEPARIVASDLGDCQGQLAYRRVDWYFPGQGQTLGDGGYFDICPN